jgi:hypothetical protein
MAGQLTGLQKTNVLSENPTIAAGLDGASIRIRELDIEVVDDCGQRHVGT